MDHTQSASLQHYTYRPLTAPSDIRILTLHPGQGSEVLSGDLKVASIDGDHIYHALSYAWDDQLPTKTIECDNCLLSITQNVFDALMELRDNAEKRRLWIDQVCINQNDKPERTAQVILMGKIYTNATKVVVWLGTADTGTGIAYQVMNRFALIAMLDGDLPDMRLITTAQNPAAAIRLHYANASEALQIELSSLLLPAPIELQCYMRLMSRTWFNRVWTVQELVLGGPRTEIRCGQYAASCAEARIALWSVWLCRYPYVLKYGEIAWSSMLNSAVAFSLCFHRENSEYTESLCSYLSSVATLSCKDPRDRIYALLGICDPRYLSYLTPDYRMDISEVYVASVRAIIKIDQSLQVLSQIGPGEGRPVGLPSWVPNWERRLPGYRFRLGVGLEDEGRRFNTSLSRLASVVPTSISRQVGLQGVRFKQVKRMIPERISLRTKRLTQDSGCLEPSTWYATCVSEVKCCGIPKQCNRSQRPEVVIHDDILFRLQRSSTFSDEALTAVALRRTLTADTYPIGQHNRLGVFHSARLFPRYNEWLRSGSPEEMPSAVLEEHGEWIETIMWNRQLFIAGEESGDAYLCIASHDTKVGDWICILYGGDVPFVLRPRVTGGNGSEAYQWEFICECYVHGIMDGEFMESHNEDESETFVLI